MMRSLALWLVLAAAILCAAPRIALAQDDPAAPSKVEQLIDLLNDPDVRSALAARAPETVPEANLTLMSSIAGLEALIRQRFSSLTQAIPRIPGELEEAAGIVARDISTGRPGAVIAILAALIGIGLIGEALIRRVIVRPRRETDRGETSVPASLLVREILPFTVFVALSVGTFLILDWPPLLRRVVLTYLVAFIAFRAVTAVARLVTAFESGAGDPPPDQGEAMARDAHRLRFWVNRIRAFLGFFLFGWATVSLLPLLGFPTDITRLCAYVLGLGLLGIAIETIWHRPRRMGHRPAAKDALLVLYVCGLYLVWVAGFLGMLWLGIYAIILPPILSLTGRFARALAERRDRQGLKGAVAEVLIVRGARALVIALAIVWLGHVWRLGLVGAASGDRYAAFIEGILHGIVILLVADMLWQISKAVIERQVTASIAAGSPAEAARHGRLRTVLPLFRNTLAVFIAVVTVLTVLSGLGIAVAPLIAGAGIFGVAIGFGSQTLVKDILSGVFYMLDDAFRVGEYIQSGSYKGTVESFSLRSIRLRHHRGAIYTVPFGDLGAVQNMSRDWVIDKMTINVTYDTDVDLARRLIKKVGLELAADPEFAENTIEPLKMQGVESFGDYAIVLRMKLMTKPGEQFRIKRKAYVMIKKAFDEKGVRIATPTVQVSGDDKGAGPAASEAMRLQKTLQAPEMAAE